MNCASCGHELSKAAKFCQECGAPAQRRCGACGGELAATAKFCPECGTTVQTPIATAQPERRLADYTPQHLAEKILQSRSALVGERKQVTVLFCDIKGSMALAAQLGAEAWHGILDRFFRILGEGVHRYEGTINQYTGDGIMALFGAPIAHEDHAQRACYAALQLREDLRRFALELRLERGLDFGVRLGLNSGEVVVGRIGDDLRMDYTAQGHTVGLAQRLEQLAEAGHVYLSEYTARLAQGYFELADLGLAKLAGDGGEVGVFDLLGATGVRTRMQVSRARGLTAFVGRADEMDILDKALARARGGHGQVVGVVGEAGLGKSRLCYEFVERCRAQGVAVYECHCPSYGRAIPFIPILELYRSYFRIDEREPPESARQKIAGTLVLLDPSLQEGLSTLFEFLGLGDPAQPAPRIEPEARQRQLFNMLHKVVRAQSARGQVSVTLVDDLHWIDDWSDAFVAQMVEAVEGSHALLLVNYRPEYQAKWTARAHCQQLPLVPLGEAALQAMVTTLLGTDPSVTALSARTLAWTAGNPLYVEEVINTLLETGQLEGRHGAYRLTREIGALEVPATVQAIIAARVDRLSETAKALLHTAAVVGKEFSRPLLERVVEIPAGDLATALERLKTADFIYETALYPTVEYAFKHPLVHEVAYETQLREQSARRHAQVAAALESLEAGRLDEVSARIAYHWEQAAAPAQAMTWHERAAGVAGLNDPQAALAHWEKVLACAEALDASREHLLTQARACRAILDIRWRLGTNYDYARALHEKGMASAERAGDTAMQAALLLNHGILRCVSAGYATEGMHIARDCVSLAIESGEIEVIHAARNLLAWTQLFSGDIDGARATGRALIDDLPDDCAYGSHLMSPNTNWSIRMCMSYVVAVRGELDECLRYSFAAERFLGNAPEWESYSSAIQGLVFGLLGDTANLVEAARVGLAKAESSGAAIALMYSAAVMGTAHLATNDPAQAVTVTRHGLDVAQRENAGGTFIPLLGAVLAQAEVRAGNPVEGHRIATAMVEFSVERGNYWALTPWLALAEACIALGDADGARAALAEARALISRTGARAFEPPLHELRAACARAFGGEWDEATELDTARRLYAELGATGHVERLDAADRGVRPQRPSR
ncbi:MAG: adenylate/guanylate cyclase domain-containing protein [Gammaproteobacteria bacterium]